jgi:flagellar hook-associated protein 2
MHVQEESAMPSSIGGLASGLNTTEIINAMLAAEQATRNRLVAKQNTYSKQLSTWTDLNSKLGSLKTAVNAVSTPTKVASATASSDDESLVYAKASSTAAPSTFTFRVSQLAAAEQKMTTGFTDVTDLVGAGMSPPACPVSG